VLFRAFDYGEDMETVLEMIIIGGWLLGKLFIGLCLFALGLRMGGFLFSPFIKK
jgi:hypothetical protein